MYVCVRVEWALPPRDVIALVSADPFSHKAQSPCARALQRRPICVFRTTLVVVCCAASAAAVAMELAAVADKANVVSVSFTRPNAQTKSHNCDHNSSSSISNNNNNIEQNKLRERISQNLHCEVPSRLSSLPVVERAEYGVQLVA